jgi:hypothetical protein
VAAHLQQGWLHLLHRLQMGQTPPAAQSFGHAGLLDFSPLMQHDHPKGLLLALAALDQVQVADLEDLQRQQSIGEQAVREGKELDFSQLWLRRL